MNTAEISGDRVCKECGWPVVFACCNGKFRDFKDAADWDWWMYCSNKGCTHHEGEGVFQNLPLWVERERR